MAAFILPFDWSVMTSSRLRNEYCHVIRNTGAKEQRGCIVDSSEGQRACKMCDVTYHNNNEHCHVIRNTRAREQRGGIVDPSRGLKACRMCDVTC